jgi:hypothetical protein
MALHHFVKLLDIVNEVTHCVSVDKECLTKAGPDGPRHLTYHRIIVVICAFFGLIGFLLGVAFVVAMVNHKSSDKNFGKNLIAPLAFLVAGLIFGISLCCSLAPSSFLKGPIGGKWVQFIRADTLLTARITSLLITMAFLSFFALVAWAAWRDLHQTSPPGF